MTVDMNIIDKTKDLEQNSKKVWGRNVFFIWWFAIVFFFTLIRAITNRICQIPRLVHNVYYNDHRAYIRKVSKYKWLENWNQLVDSKFWSIIVLFLFFFSMALGKTLYHLGKITFFLWVHIIKPLLWMLVVLVAAKSIGEGVNGKKLT